MIRIFSEKRCQFHGQQPSLFLSLGFHSQPNSYTFFLACFMSLCNPLSYDRTAKRFHQTQPTRLRFYIDACLPCRLVSDRFQRITPVRTKLWGGPKWAEGRRQLLKSQTHLLKWASCHPHHEIWSKALVFLASSITEVTQSQFAFPRLGY